MKNYIRTIKTHKTSFFVFILMISMIAASVFLILPAANSPAINDNQDTTTNNNEDTTTTMDKTTTTDLGTIPKSSSSSDWWNISWLYRVPIDILSTTQDLSNYQVGININLTNFYDLGYINENGNDIRFTNTSNDELNYWIEEMDVSGGNSTIWVRVPTLIHDQITQIYMYFGNPNAAAKSSINSTLDSGLRYFYYASTFSDNVGHFTTFICTGVYATSPNFMWGDGRVAVNTSNSLESLSDDVAIRWEGWVSPQGSGVTTFYVITDDGSLLYVNNSLVISGWKQQGDTTYHNTYNFASPVNITYEWYEHTGGATSRLGWIPASGGPTVYPIPGNHLWNRKYTSTEPTVTIGNLINLVKVTCVDTDGSRVPDAQVFVSNATRPYLDRSGTTDENGELTLVNITGSATYDIVVNYTTTNKLFTKTIFHTEEFHLTSTELLIPVNLWTINFKVTDWDNQTMDYGYVLVYNNTSPFDSSNLIDNITLASGTGLATFRWINKTDYTYRIYYHNQDFFKTDTLLNTSTIYRTDKSRNQPFNVNETSTITLPGHYYVDETVYAEGSSAGGKSKIGHVQLINATIDMKKMTTKLTSINIYYVDANGVDQKLYDASKTYSGTVTEDTIQLDDIEKYNAYGLRVVVEGTNSSRCDGVINISWMETTSMLLRANMSKMQIKIEDGGVGVVGAIVRIWNGTQSTGQSVINLTTSSGEVYGKKGYAYGDINKIAFWYLRGAYNITVDIGTQPNYLFKVNKTTPEQWKPTIPVNIYNYTLEQNSTIILNLANTADFMTNFSYYIGDDNILWRNNMSYTVNFTYTEHGEAGPWHTIIASSHVYCSVYLWGSMPTLLYQEEMSNLGNGFYTSEFNSSRFSAGTSSKSYVVQITGEYKGFSDPLPVYFFVTINALPTDLKFYKYPSLTGNGQDEIDQYYNEMVNVSVKYQPQSSLYGLQGASLKYKWQYATSPVIINPDPLHLGYYTFEINTSQVTNIGEYTFTVSASKTNYSAISESFVLVVNSRPTKINGTTKALHNSTSIWVGNDFIVYYAYKDTLSGDIIGNADNAYYYWSELDASGQPINFSNNIKLEKASHNWYELDFDASGKDIGQYSIYVIFEKSNHDGRSATINLEIKRRIFSTSLSLNNGTGTTVSVVKGQPVIITLTLTDLTRGGTSSSSLGTQAKVPLSGATVTLYITELAMSFTLTEKEKTGVYTLTIDTSDPIYQAFFTPQTLTGNFTVEKHNYETQTIPFTLVVGMTEILPGFPTFYFILLVVGIGAVVGSLATYRYIQVAKIPKFVKDVRKMKKNIKAEENIPEALAYPSKKEMMAELMGDKWKAIGLSLEQILGIESKKGKTLPDLKEDKLEGGAI